jgi:hypothetical protein
LGSDEKRFRGIYLEMIRFFEENRKSAIFEKKRSSDTDKVPEDQGDEPKIQFINPKREKRIFTLPNL